MRNAATISNEEQGRPAAKHSLLRYPVQITAVWLSSRFTNAFFHREVGPLDPKGDW